jgi:CubicO group peptidase (beta-lactamase class C family)/D-alanyl-D-alanine dipeptidase
MMRIRRLAWWAGVTVAAAAPRAGAQAVIDPPREYAALADSLTRFITHEMADKDLPALSIALVVDSVTVWAHGFGVARPGDSVPATAETVYRVGSVSKLFTDIAVMRLVTRGALDLDAPVSRYLPGFHPGNPTGTPITLRQLMTHHAGLVREPPVGSYFDSTAPPLSAIVASLNRTTVVYPPGTRYKYSNAALQVVGAALERVAGEPFPEFLRREVLGPLGMTHSAFFDPPPRWAADLAAATMGAADGRRFPAPTFRRNAPSGALYTTVVDLGRFLAALFADSNPVISRRTLERMWTPQFAPAGAAQGNGLGFFVSRFQGHRRVGHDGAIYGFATTFAALPDDRVGVVVVTTLDAANTVTDRIADAALAGLLAARAGTSIPLPPMTRLLPAGFAAGVAGHYVGPAGTLDLLARGGELLLARDGSAVPVRVRASGDTLTLDDATGFGGSVQVSAGRVILNADTFALRPEPAPPPPPPLWRNFVGEYGWGYETLFIYERGGRLHALIEWLEDDALTRKSDTVFAFPRTSMYVGEEVTFHGTRSGTMPATEAMAGAVTFPRRAIGPQGGAQLKIHPVRPVPELLAEARVAVPPAEAGSFRAPDLVDLASLDSTLHFDIRYATTNNFLGSPLYESARAFLQRPAAEALVRAARRLRAMGYGLLIHDAYRPWYVTKTFWDATPVAQRWLVANPAQGSRHNRGCAVDLTLYNLRTGRPVDMGGTYDEVTERTYPDYPVTTDLERWHRDLLRRVMEDAGFVRLATEWWHFDYSDWRSYPILNTPFSELEP